MTILAGDGTYSSSQTFTINVGGEITIAPIAAQTNYELDSVSLSVSATDSSSGTLTYSAVGLPAGLSINTATGTITGTIADGASANGPYNVVVTASDGTYSASQAFTWNVNNPITIQSVVTQDWSAGQTINLQIQATDMIPDVTLHYVATGLPAGLSINPTTGAITGTISNVLSNLGAISTTVTVTDGDPNEIETIAWNIASGVWGVVSSEVTTLVSALAKGTIPPDYTVSNKGFTGGTTTFLGWDIKDALQVVNATMPLTYGTLIGVGGTPRSNSFGIPGGPFTMSSTVFGRDGGNTKLSFYSGLGAMISLKLNDPSEMAFYSFRQTVSSTAMSPDAVTKAMYTVAPHLDGGPTYPSSLWLNERVMSDSPGLPRNTSFDADLLMQMVADDGTTVRIIPPAMNWYDAYRDAVDEYWGGQKKLSVTYSFKTEVLYQNGVMAEPIVKGVWTWSFTLSYKLKGTKWVPVITVPKNGISWAPN